jgi:RNA polymerase sigma-70 factor (ECF subfamily)
VRQAVSETIEDELVAAARSGGVWAFAQLWELLSPRVAAYVRSRGVAHPDDVTSEVFLGAFARIGDFRGGGLEFRRYLFTLAHHKSVDEIRARFSPRVPRHVQMTEGVDPRCAPSAEDVALEGQLDHAVAAVLATLPAAQREVLLLRVVAGLDLAEVAAIVGRSEGATKQLQHRALQSLRRQLPGQTRRGSAVTVEVTPPMAGAT